MRVDNEQLLNSVNVTIHRCPMQRRAALVVSALEKKICNENFRFLFVELSPSSPVQQRSLDQQVSYHFGVTILRGNMERGHS